MPETLPRPLLWAFACIVPLAACGQGGTSNDAENSTPKAWQNVQAFDVVPLSPDYGPGTEVAVPQARQLPDGTLQVLLEGSSCSAPTKLQIDETADKVSIAAYAFKADGRCSAEIVPWYVVAPTEQPVGGRQLVTRAGETIPVIDCGAEPAHARCEVTD
jgi:hypothetical protein